MMIVAGEVSWTTLLAMALIGEMGIPYGVCFLSWINCELDTLKLVCSFQLSTHKHIWLAAKT